MKKLKGTCKHCGHIQEETTKHNNVSCSTGYCDKCGKVGMNMYPVQDWEKEFEQRFGVCDTNPLIGYKNLDIEASSRCRGTVKDVKEFIEEQRKQAKIEDVRGFARWLDKEYSSAGIFNPKEGAEEYIKNLEGEK